MQKIINSASSPFAIGRIGTSTSTCSARGWLLRRIHLDVEGGSGERVVRERGVGDAHRTRRVDRSDDHALARGTAQLESQTRARAAAAFERASCEREMARESICTTAVSSAWRALGPCSRFESGRGGAGRRNPERRLAEQTKTRGADEEHTSNASPSSVHATEPGTKRARASVTYFPDERRGVAATAPPGSHSVVSARGEIVD